MVFIYKVPCCNLETFSGNFAFLTDSNVTSVFLELCSSSACVLFPGWKCCQIYHWGGGGERQIEWLVRVVWWVRSYSPVPVQMFYTVIQDFISSLATCHSGVSYTSSLRSRSVPYPTWSSIHSWSIQSRLINEPFPPVWHGMTSLGKLRDTTHDAR